jgi:MFS family permease
MRWSDLDSASKSALVLGAALFGLGAAAIWLSFHLQERWPLFIFLSAFFGVVLFLSAVGAWERFTRPKETSLAAFKQTSLFGLRVDARRASRNGWTLARDVCLLLLVTSLAAFVLHSIIIGGDALRGHVDQGRYYVRVRTTVTEVSAAQWRWNWWLGCSVFALLPLSVLVTLIAAYKERHDRFRYLDLD